MRTYDDTFSGEKIYPGKVWRSQSRQLFRRWRNATQNEEELEELPTGAEDGIAGWLG